MLLFQKSVLLAFACCILFFSVERNEVGTKSIAAADSSKLYVPDDLEATLWAEAPMFFNPTNMDIDARGRVWITEAVNYRDFNTKPNERLTHKQKGDRVMILEDKDGDGKAESSKVYVEDTLLTAPLGIAVIGNKTIVSCAPNLIVYTDINGDDKPDQREVLLTGFGGFDHDHSLHSLVAGPDGRYYFNTGNAGPHKVTDKSGWTLRSGSLYTGGTPYNNTNQGNQKSDDGRVWVGGLALRINPDGTGLKVLGHNFRNSYEYCLDSYGNMWQNDNDDQVITCRVSFLQENGNAGYFSEDGTRYWQADRRPGQDIFTTHWHQEDPGVMPAGDNTGAGSPTGIVFYEGDQLGKNYRGTLLSCEAGRNVIFAYQPKPKGAGFELKRRDLISTFPQVSEHYEWFETDNDYRKWFRPSDIAVGPDGALYIADWYDPVVGGHAMKDKKGYGRIFRITPKGKELTTPKLDLSTTAGLINALKSPAVNVRLLGFEGLKKKGAAVIPEVKKLLTAENPFYQARAIWLLANLGSKGHAEVFNLLKSSNGQHRLTAFRALRATGDISPYLTNAASDPDAAVRREAAIALRDIPFSKSEAAFDNLLNHYHGNDPWLLEAIGTAASGKEDSVLAFAMRTSRFAPENWPVNIADLAWRLHPVSAVDNLHQRAGSEKVAASERRRAVTAIGFIKDKKAVDAMVALSKSALPHVASQASWWLNFRKTNDWADLRKWEEEEQTSNADQNVPAVASPPVPKNGKVLETDAIFRLKGDLEKGKQVFETYCTACHKHGSEGAEIGPDLTLIHKKLDKSGLLDAIVNPSSSVVFGYESYTIVMKNGQTYYGFLISDGPTVVIKDAAGKQHALKATHIKTREKMPVSLMPEPAALGLNEQDLADLTSYLLHFK